MPFFGGYLVDRVGVRFSLLLYSSLITVGQIIFTLGLMTKSWPIIFLGRLVFGFGGESFTVANSALLSDWFKGRELAFAFGVNLAISKLGSVINNILSPILADRVDIIFALWFGAMLCGMGVVCVLITMPIDRALDTQLDKTTKYSALQQGENDTTNVLLSPIVGENDEKDSTSTYSTEAPQVSFRDVLSLSHIFWVLVVSCVTVYGCILPFNNISSSLLLERDYFIEPSSSCHLSNIYECQSSTNPPENCPSSKWYQPPLPYNATVANEVYDPLETSDIDCSSDDWKHGCTEEYCSRQNHAISQASVTMSIPYIISAVLSPPLGYAVDIYGMRAVIAFISPLLLIAVHSCLGFTDMNPVIPLVGQGLAYSGFVSVLWPSVPLVVEEEITGLAFGIVTSMQNLATAIIPLIVAQIYSDGGDKYIPNVEVLFIVLAIIGAFVGAYMNYYDYYYGDSVLNSPCLLEEDDDDDNDSKPSRSETNNPMAGTAVMEDSESSGRVKSEDQDVRNSRGGDERAHSVDAHRRNQRSADHSHSAHHPHHVHTHGHHHHHRQHRGTSFTAYEEVMRGGGYRTSSSARLASKDGSRREA